jgi:hypothetical protein
MSGWTGVVLAGIAFVVVLGMFGEPLWQARVSDPPQAFTWSYGFFDATNSSLNSTTSYNYGSLPKQPNLAAAFLAAQKTFLIAIVAQVAAAGLSVGTALRRLRGIFAGVAFATSCALSLYTSLNLVLTIPQAAADFPPIGGLPINQFEGQTIGGCGSNLCGTNYGPGLAWYLLLGLGILLAFAATEVWHVRPLTTSGPSKPAVQQRRLTVPPPPDKVEPVIEEVFVISASGLLIKHMSRSLMQDMDRDVVGGMISVVSSFVREAFPERDGTVKEVSLGDHRFVMASERGLVVAALVTRGETEDVLHRLRHLLAVLLDRYSTKLEDWKGESLDGIEDEIGVLWEPFFVPPPPAD